MESRQCKKCGQVKPVTEFYKSGVQDGKQYYRTVCVNCALSKRLKAKKDLAAKGEKRCTSCGEAMPLEQFYTDKRASDGRKSVCKVCFGNQVKAYRETPQGARMVAEKGKRYRQTAKWRESHRLNIRRQRAEKRYEQQERARKYVWDRIRRNGFPRPSANVCADCGKPATQYHHESYERDRWLDVTPLCDLCHKRRHIPA